MSNVLEDAIRVGLMEARDRRLNRNMAAKVIEKSVRDALHAHGAELFAGVGEAAEMVDLPKPRIARLTEQGRMPVPVVKLAAGPVWLRPEVQKLAEELAEERAAREARRAERNGDGDA